MSSKMVFNKKFSSNKVSNNNVSSNKVSNNKVVVMYVVFNPYFGIGCIGAYG